MALSREDIQSMLDNSEMSNAEKAAWLLDKHLDTVNGLKSEVADYKIKLGNAQKELDGVKQNGNGYKEKYDKEHSDFEKFKADVAAEKAQAGKEKAYRAMLKDVLSEKGVEKAVKYADWSKIELDEKGELKNAAEHVKAVKEEWSEHVSNSVVHNAPVANPPINTGGTAKTKNDIMNIKDAAARQKAIAENMQLFRGVNN